MSYHLYSSVFELSGGKTLDFPWLNLFLELQLFCQMSFCSLMSLLDAPAFSLPRHNCSSSLYLRSELPAELISTCLVWVRRGGAVPPLQPLYDSLFDILCCSARSFTLRVGS
jgi:hypothetical protein